MQISCIVGPYKYELFDVISETHLETVISLHISSENIITELYVEFIDADRCGLSSTSVMVNMGTKVQAKSPTTQLCGGFSSLLQSGCASMGRHLQVSGIDLNFGDQYHRGINITQI
ncbi:hypothetical protein J1N35_041230 [Gossypium stocksii]|uniref:Uncharacterized protein n=1 Tax=Gossypium stocksii TaxID=47602 RepID=A0A9D3UFF7_9ROSI|nr:hypothetical protein J1N35_041230 [Gossypium stocksii]